MASNSQKKRVVAENGGDLEQIMFHSLNTMNASEAANRFGVKKASIYNWSNGEGLVLVTLCLPKHISRLYGHDRREMARLLIREKDEGNPLLIPQPDDLPW